MKRMVCGGIGKNFNQLPEGCVSHIISFTSPRDACRAAAVSTTFRSAVASDRLWDKFLPSDIENLLQCAVEPIDYASKKELYFRLCDSILIDNGKMSFSLDKLTGRRYYMLSARRLYITWSGDPMYWKWIHRQDSRFAEVAKLKSVCWLEITGTIQTKMLTPKTTYVAYLVYKIADKCYGLQDKQKTSIWFGAYSCVHQICLQPKIEENIDPQHEEWRTGKERDDGWMEMEMGEFYVENGEDNDEVRASLTEVEKLWWKKGLIVEGIEFRPKH